MTEKQIDIIRLICSGRSTNVIRELVVLHRRKGRPDLAELELMMGNAERAAEHERFEPEWDAATSAWEFSPGIGRTSHRKTDVRVVPGRRGGQVVHVPGCPDCGRGGGLRLPMDKVEEAARARGSDIDVSGLCA